MEPSLIFPRPINKEEWLASPVRLDEWPLEIPPPNKATFVDWLETEIGITEFNTQFGLWSNIVFSSMWLIRDERKRPFNKDLRKRIDKLEKHIHALESVLKADEKSGHIDSWLKHLLVNAQIEQGWPNAIRSILHNLILMRKLLKRSRIYLDRRPSGRPPDDTLWDWVEALNMQIELFNIVPISVDFEHGEPITPYARIVHKAVEMLDPERLPKVPHVLRRLQTERNRSKSDPD